MKLKLLIPFILLCNIVFAGSLDTLFPQKANPGFYSYNPPTTSNYTDQQIYALMFGAGAVSTRSTVDIASAQPPYSYTTYTARLAYMYNTLGMRKNVFFLVCNPGPVYTGQSTKITAGGHRSIVPNGIFLNPFNPDSSINQNNVWAAYVGNVMTNYGAFFDYFQVWNEPDFTNTSKGGDTTNTVPGNWRFNKPVPDDMPNLYDSIEDYVQLAKVANQVVKHYKPSAKIIGGGFGYAYWYAWFIQLGGAQWLDQLDIHSYPMYYWTTCVWNGTGCAPNAGGQRNSDVAANFVDSAFNAFRAVERAAHTTLIPMSTTEIALPRWSMQPSNATFPNNKYFGSSACQRNFLGKAFQILMQDSAVFVTMYQTGDDADSGQTTGNDLAGHQITPFSAMGLYQNLVKPSAVGHEVITPMGIGYRTSANLLANYTVNLTKPSAVAGTRVVRWDSSGNEMLVAWAIVTHDTVETASGTIVLPAGVTFTEFDWQQNNLGTVSGTVNIDGSLHYFRQNAGAVNNPPTVSAGANQNITANNTSVTGTAVANTGSISSTAWTQVSGPNTAVITTPSSLTTTITGLINGTYVFKLSATNTVPLTSSANVTITVAITPLPPTAVASSSVGSITLPATDSLQLIGTGSFDNNAGGFIAQYQWTLANGKKGGQIIRNPSSGNTYVVFDSVGTYTYQLKVFNNGGQSATNTVTVLVNQTLVGLNAVVLANNIVTLPLNQIFLNGTGSSDPNPNGVIINYQWNLNLSPPGSTAVLNLQTNPIVTLAPVIPGTYIIQLTITDNLGQTGSVTVQITVNSNMIITNKIVKSVH